MQVQYAGRYLWLAENHMVGGRNSEPMVSLENMRFFCNRQPSLTNYPERGTLYGLGFLFRISFSLCLNLLSDLCVSFLLCFCLASSLAFVSASLICLLFSIDFSLRLSFLLVFLFSASFSLCLNFLLGLASTLPGAMTVRSKITNHSLPIFQLMAAH